MDNLRVIGPPRHTEEDIEFARKIQENLGLEPMEQPYDEALTARACGMPPQSGST